MPILHLATTQVLAGSAGAPQAVGRVHLQLEELPSFAYRGPGQRFARFTMPAPGTCYQDSVRLPSASAALRLVLECGNDRAAFVLGPITDADVISLVGGQAPPGHFQLAPSALSSRIPSPSLYAGTVVHSSNDPSNPCEVRCDSGNVHADDDCCVVCRDGSTTVKFCC